MHSSAASHCIHTNTQDIHASHAQTHAQTHKHSRAPTTGLEVKI